MATTLKDALEEIEELKRKIKELSVDELTGLPRKTVIQEAVKGEILRYKRSKQKFSIFVVDINCLKTVNDTMGHLAGDHLIASFATCLRGALRKCDFVARTGGDEFMVFAPDQNRTGAESLKKFLLKKFSQKKSGIAFFSGAAIGSATFEDDGRNFVELYQSADRAMYAHKSEMKKCK